MIDGINSHAAIVAPPEPRPSPNMIRPSEDLTTRYMEVSMKSMMFHADRTMVNEEAARSLSKVFGKFSLIQKIMQSMQ